MRGLNATQAFRNQQKGVPGYRVADGTHPIQRPRPAPGSQGESFLAEESGGRTLGSTPASRACGKRGVPRPSGIGYKRRDRPPLRTTSNSPLADCAHLVNLTAWLVLISVF